MPAGGLMWFGVLGPLTLVDDDGDRVTVAGARQRILLAALLVRVNRPVPADELIETLWNGTRPSESTTILRSVVMRLRRTLGPEGAARIEATAPGYLIRVADTELDLLQFEALCGRTQAAVRRAEWPEAAQTARQALQLWRDSPLLDVPSQALREQFVPHLEHLHLQTMEGEIEAGLHLGLHDALVPQVRDLAAAYPLREHFHAQLMLALYLSGRTAEALEAFQTARRHLVEQLGLEPGPALRDLHRRILDGDPELIIPPGPTPPGTPPPVPAPPRTDDEPPSIDVDAGPTAAPVPRQLPASAPYFVGRETQLAALGACTEQATSGATATLVVSAIGGMAGVGKTALAVHFAHQVADSFPDGQLYVNLRGYDADEPVSAADALAGFLHALGANGRDIPCDPYERAARYRSLLAGRRMLVVLDNARGAQHVRPLLPGASGCLALVTSRDSLAGLVARDGAVRIDLDVLAPSDALGLLRALIGPRAYAEPEAAAALARMCCRLPLALRIAAELAAARPAAALAALVDELADRRRLDLLGAGGDGDTDVRAVFSWSYRYLDADTARAFRLLSLHPGTDHDRYAAAALLGTDLPRAQQLLDVLVRAHLIQSPHIGRYGMHDLLRAYARELAAEADTDEERHAALTGLYDHYLCAAAAAADALFVLDEPVRSLVPTPAGPVPDLAERSAAFTWLDAERANLLAAARHMAETDWPGHATRLSPLLFRYLDTTNHLSDARFIHGHARRAAARTGDRAAEAIAVRHLGCVEFRQGRYEQATDDFRHSLALFCEIGDRVGQARSLHNLGLTEEHQGLYEEAAGHYRQALALKRAVGDHRSEMSTLARIGVVERRQGRYEQAADHFEQARSRYRATRARLGRADVLTTSGEAEALTNLGVVDMYQGRYAQAAVRHRRALALCRGIDDQRGQTEILTNLGSLEACRGHYAAAAEYLQHAVALCREVDDRYCETEAISQLGIVHLRRGDHRRAADHQRRALASYRELGDRHGQGRALARLALTGLAAGRHRQALAYLEQALLLSRELGASPLEAAALNGIGEVHLATNDPDRALAHHTAALALAHQIGDHAEQIRAHHGLARAHAARGDKREADRHHTAERDLDSRPIEKQHPPPDPHPQPEP